MILLGLTGSIGMGKSTVAQMFGDLGVPVFDADAAVHALYARGGAAVARVGQRFPAALADGAIDRERLSAAVVGQPAEIRALEAIVHPLVRAEQQRFLAEAHAAGAKLAVLDIPLLFESGGAQKVDRTLVVSAPEPIQRARVLARPGMSAGKLEAILARQMPDAEKRRRADFVIDTGGSLDETLRQVRELVRMLA